MTHSRSSPSTRRVVLALGTIYVVWGSTYLAIAYVVESLPPFTAAAVRFLLAGAILTAFVVAQHRWRRRSGGSVERLERPGLAQWRTAVIVGGLLLLGSNGLVMVAVQTIPSGIAAVIIGTAPLWISLFDALLTRRRPRWVAIGGLLVGMVGVTVLLFPERGMGALDPLGLALLVLANVSWAAGSLYARHSRMPPNQLLGSGMQQLGGGAALALAALTVGDLGRLDLGSVSLASWLSLAYLVIFGSLLAFTAYVWLLNHVAVTTVATHAYVNPVVAVALGMLIRGEQLTPRTLLAAALIVGAVVAMVSGRQS